MNPVYIFPRKISSFLKEKQKYTFRLSSARYTRKLCMLSTGNHKYLRKLYRIIVYFQKTKFERNALVYLILLKRTSNLKIIYWNAVS